MIKNIVDKCYLLNQLFGNDDESFIYGLLIRWNTSSLHYYTLIEDKNNGTVGYSNYCYEEKHLLDWLINSRNNLHLSEFYEVPYGTSVTQVYFGAEKKTDIISNEFIVKSDLLHGVKFCFENNETLTIYNIFDELEIRSNILSGELPDWIEWENRSNIFFPS